MTTCTDKQVIGSAWEEIEYHIRTPDHEGLHFTPPDHRALLSQEERDIQPGYFPLLIPLKSNRQPDMWDEMKGTVTFATLTFYLNRDILTVKFRNCINFSFLYFFTSVATLENYATSEDGTIFSLDMIIKKNGSALQSGNVFSVHHAKPFKIIIIILVLKFAYI